MQALPFHSRPKRQHGSGRHVHGETPYQWREKEAGSWRIGFGVSSFLVAEGSGFSRAHGKRILKSLQDDWQHRRKARRPKKRIK